MDQYFPNDVRYHAFKVQDGWIFMKQSTNSSWVWLYYITNKPIRKYNFLCFAIVLKKEYPVWKDYKSTLPFPTSCLWDQVFFLHFNQNNVLQQTECRSRFENPAPSYEAGRYRDLWKYKTMSLFSLYFCFGKLFFIKICYLFYMIDLLFLNELIKELKLFCFNF